MQVEDSGIEPTAKSPGFPGVSSEGGAKSGAVGARNPTPAGPESHPDLTDPELAEVVARWPALPEAVRQSIVGLVRGAVAGGD